jgi:methionyl-tRNA formyltransferase
VRVLFAGTPASALPSLEALLRSRHEVAAVLTRPDAPAGRGRKLTASPVKARALDAGLEVLTPAGLSEPAFQSRLRQLSPDCCPVVAFGVLIPPAALVVPASGWVNLHFSLLPAWRGAAPVQHAILAGEEVTGATTFQIEAGLDTGPVYGVLTEEVRPTDTAGELLERLADAGAALLLATLDGISEGRLEPVPQPAEGISTAPKLTADDVRIDWRAPALRVDRLARAATPEPGAWTVFRGTRLGVGPVRRVSQAAGSLAPGELAPGRRDVAVGTATAPVRLTDVQPEGRRAMPAEAWARGVRLHPGDRLT